MSPALGITYTTNEILQAGSGTVGQTGRAFFAGVCDQGPPPALGTPYVRCASINDYTIAFGPRSSTSATLYDSVDAFFHEGGSVCYVTRVTDGTAVKATLTLQDSVPHPTVVVTALTAGIDGNAVEIAVTTSGGSFTVLVEDTVGDILETHGPYTSTAQLFADTTSAYVSFLQSAGSGFTTANPATLAPTALTGGVNPTDIVDANYASSLNNFPPALGPGTVAIPGRNTSTIWTALGQHAAANNRLAAVDIPDTATAATLITAMATLNASAYASYFIVAGAQCLVPNPFAVGTTRTVPASAIVAALRARVSATGNDNQAPAGVKWPLQYVSGFTNTYSYADTQSLNAVGFNTFQTPKTGLGLPAMCLCGFSSAALYTADPIFWQASAGAERMALVYYGTAILNNHLFESIDGGGLLIGKVGGELQGLIATHWGAGALYGANATDAGVAIMSAPINTTTSEQAGALNANLEVRISPFMQSGNLGVTSIPITSTISV